MATWKQIVNLLGEFKNNIKKVQNGKQIRLWSDRWRDERLLKNQFSTIYSLVLDQKCFVADCFVEGGCNFHFKRIFNDWELDEVASFLQKIQCVKIGGEKENTQI